MESKPLLSDFDAQIKYYQRLETQIEELPSSYHIGPVEYLTERIKEALVTETKAWKQAFGKALAEKVTIICVSVVVRVIALILDLKGLCHGSPVHFVYFSNYSPSIAMKLKVSKEITCK